MDLNINIMQRKDILVFLVVLGLAAMIGYNQIYKGAIAKAKALQVQAKEEEKKNEILGFIGIIDAKVRNYQKQSLPSQEITYLLDRISTIAQQLGIKLETFNPLPAVHKAQYVELPVKLPLRCQYHKLGKFLSLLESNKELIWVKEIIIDKPTVLDSRNARIPKISLTVSGIYLKK